MDNTHIDNIDRKRDFLQEVADNPDSIFYVYFGLKAAPLTLAHERIIDYLVDEFVRKYKNIHLRIGIADSEFREKFSLVEMVQDFVCKHYPDIELPENNWYADQLRVVRQDGWQGLYDWLKNENYKGKRTLVVVGEDEAEHIAKDDGVWKNVPQFVNEYRFHVAKMRDDGISATKAREIFYRDPDVDYYYVKDLISKWIYDWIKQFGTFWQLKENYRAEENNFIEKYDPSVFERPSVTVDNIVWSEFNGKKYILLIRRGGHPYKGFWALPGGFLDMNDKNLRDAARRELREEALPDIIGFDSVQFKTYSDKGTDPRTRIVDVVYATQLDWVTITKAKAGDDAAEMHIFPVDELPRLGFNHAQIIREYFKSLSV